jgi:formylmethanofuran dehydrogenase subunit E
MNALGYRVSEIALKKLKTRKAEGEKLISNIENKSYAVNAI